MFPKFTSHVNGDVFCPGEKDATWNSTNGDRSPCTTDIGDPGGVFSSEDATEIVAVQMKRMVQYVV